MTKQTYKVTVDLGGIRSYVAEGLLRELIAHNWRKSGLTVDRVQVEKVDEEVPAAVIAKGSITSATITDTTIKADQIKSSFIPIPGQSVARKNLPGRVGRIVFVHPNGKFNVHFPEQQGRRESTTYNATTEKFFLVR